MRKTFKLIVLLVGVITAVVIFGPRETVDMRLTFDETQLPTNPADLPTYLAQSEAQFADIRVGQAKQIIWNGKIGAQTPLAIVYIHGFSASSAEIRPVPDMLAKNLGANLFYTRLEGHGRSGQAMGEARAHDWVQDVAEAMAIGRKIGKEVVLVSTSTGGALATLAAADPLMAQDLAGLIFVSPNYKVHGLPGLLLDLPFVQHWGTFIIGPARSIKPRNPLIAEGWATQYPSKALFPMSDVARFARAQDVTAIKTPALFVYSHHDRVVDPKVTTQIAQTWGGSTEVITMDADGPNDDPHQHVIFGTAQSPSQTAKGIEIMTSWVRDFLL